MGEIADDIINGDMDYETGEWLGNGQGYPRTRNSFVKHSAKKGLHNWLSKNIAGYKPSDLNMYLAGFAKYINMPNESDTPELASAHFSRWVFYVKQIVLKLLNPPTP